jgi:hypothetical protein
MSLRCPSLYTFSEANLVPNPSGFYQVAPGGAGWSRVVTGRCQVVPGGAVRWEPVCLVVWVTIPSSMPVCRIVTPC